MNGWVERRGYPRARVDFALKLEDAISIIETRAKDISCSGLYCQIARPIPVMTKVDIILLLPSHERSVVGITEIKCKGIVVRSQLRAERDELFYDTAIFFTELNEKDKDMIAQYVENQFGKGLDRRREGDSEDR